MEPKNSNSWPTKKLGEICDILDSLRKPVTKRDRENGPYHYYGATGIQDHVNNYIFDEDLVLVGEDGAKWDAGESSAYRISGKTWVNNHAHVLRPHRNLVLDDWLVHFLNVSDLTIYITGATVKKLNQAKLRAIEIPLPPIDEQKRIVAKLEKLLGKVKEARKLRKESQELSKNLLPAELHKIFEDGKKKGWKEYAFGEISYIARGGSPRPISEYITESADGINWIKIGDATLSNKYIYNTKQKIKPEGLRNSRKVDEGDLLLSNSMSFGRPYIMKTRGAIHDGWLVIKPNRKIIDEEFLYQVLSAPQTIVAMNYLAGGAVVKNLNIDRVNTIQILTPPLFKQKEIVERLDAISEKVKKLQEYQNQTAEDLNKLEQSILHQAFSGNLFNL